MKPEKDAPVTAAEWIAQATDGELDHAQKTALTEWLRESPRNVREYVELMLLREDLGAVPLVSDQVDAWVQEARQSTASPLLSSPLPAPRGEGRVRGIYFGLAASILVVLGCAASYLWWQSGRYSTGFGEQKILTLADGSVATLNTSSELKVDFSDNRRALKLVKGEAFFRVAHDPSRPFEVMAQGATVRALGTQFNVRISSQATVVSVLDGLVEVKEKRTTAPQDAVRLKEGEETWIDREAMPGPATLPPVVKAERTAALRAAAWTRGRVEFEAMPMGDVLNEFQRYRQFEVEIAESLRDLKLTGSFDAQDPEAAFSYIATLPGILVENPEPQRYVIRRK